MKTAAFTGLAVGVSLMGAGGWAAWNSASTAHHNAFHGVLTVDVVPPTEPDLPPASILAVGDLRTGYVHNPDRLQPPAVLDADYEAYLDDAWSDAEAPPETPPAERSSGLVWVTPQATTPVRLEPNDYSFGFDQPLPERGRPGVTEMADHPGNGDLD